MTDVALMSRKRRIEAGLASPVSRMLVLSNRKLTTAPRGQPMRKLSSAAVRWNAAALLLHLLGHISGLPHKAKHESKVMAPFQITTIYAIISILATSLYLVRVQSLFLPRKEKRILTEHLAVANAVIFLSILLACIGLFLLVGGLMFLMEIYIFPAGLMKTWPTLLALPVIHWTDKLRLAAFISTIGVTTGALAGGFESRTIIQHLAIF